MTDLATSQFEAIKVSLKQDKSGYILTLNVHPDELPEDVMRDFVGARYQVVIVRLNDDESPMIRKTPGVIAAAGILCRTPRYWEFLMDQNEMVEPGERNAVEAMHRILGVNSRHELTEKRDEFAAHREEYEAWDKTKVPF